MENESFDYVVVGAGSAGCVLVNRLTEGGGHSVLLLESGPPDRYRWIHIPIGYAKTMVSAVYNWRFYTEPEAQMHDRKIYWPRGRTLGGTSSINGLVYIRGKAEDYDHCWSLVVMGLRHLNQCTDHHDRRQGRRRGRRHDPIGHTRSEEPRSYLNATLATGGQRG